MTVQTEGSYALSCGVGFKVVLTLSLWTKTLTVVIQMKENENSFYLAVQGGSDF